MIAAHWHTMGGVTNKNYEWLSSYQMRRIELNAAAGATIAELADKYGVTPETIAKILIRRSR